MGLSRAPRIVRKIISPVKSLATAWSVRTAPHAQLLNCELLGEKMCGKQRDIHDDAEKLPKWKFDETPGDRIASHHVANVENT